MMPVSYTHLDVYKRQDEYNVGITWSKSGLSVFDYISVTLDGYYNDVTDKVPNYQICPLLLLLFSA